MDLECHSRYSGVVQRGSQKISSYQKLCLTLWQMHTLRDAGGPMFAIAPEAGNAGVPGA